MKSVNYFDSQFLSVKVFFLQNDQWLNSDIQNKRKATLAERAEMATYCVLQCFYFL